MTWHLMTTPPTRDGTYLVYAPSDGVFITGAQWRAGAWFGLEAGWCAALTHWAVVEPPS